MTKDDSRTTNDTKPWLGDVPGLFARQTEVGAQAAKKAAAAANLSKRVADHGP